MRNLEKSSKTSRKPLKTSKPMLLVHGIKKEQKLEGKVCLSLDAWTSSNQYPFLAIVAHYVTNDGQLGENVAEVVWATLELFGLFRKIIALVMDNTSNNNTLMTLLEWRCQQWGYRSWHTMHACVACLIPFTWLLSSFLKALGVISKVEGKQAAMHGGNYQDNVTAPLSHEHDNNAVGDDKDDESVVDMPDADADTANVDAADSILSGIGRLWKIVKSVHSSPQRCQSWAREIQFVQLEGGQALDYRNTINSYVS
ncbi:hypothetical protein F5148DRAFT_1153303 [Russula earlei]|uniref:Uncharacterized protein n=1 Tax=Russula earlei TaxID=71964 RepID=A0ACC0TUU4_9AGAM|nr:hypothetical protein F5148DRAFT_1153303 [Russula earlei]